MNEKIRIKDIAEKAGVSTGTVDRVLHNRPNVSKKALEQVEKVLAEMNYQPNAYASALAYNRKYLFVAVMPLHDCEAYWDKIEEGINHAMNIHHDFQVDVRIIYYERFSHESFNKTVEECFELQPDGVSFVAPTDLKMARQFTDKLQEKQIPFVLVDSFVPDSRPLSFYGQDAYASGKFAARMLMLASPNEKKIMILRRTFNGQFTSRQQTNREVGFRNYMRDYYPDVKIVDLDLPIDAKRDERDVLLEKCFKKHPDIHQCFTPCAWSYVVSEFLLRSNRRDVQIMGYDAIERNVTGLMQGTVSFLIAQHPFLQGYRSIDALFQAVVLKKEVEPMNYMPLELLTKENVKFYRPKQI